MATPERLTCIFHEQDPIVAPRRSSDDLPVHVKGIVRWYPDAEPQAGYYIPKKYSPSGDFEPLEFINNQWFSLFGHPETSTTQLCTRASAAIPIVNHLGIGYWDITDPEHPDCHDSDVGTDYFSFLLYFLPTHCSLFVSSSYAGCGLPFVYSYTLTSAVRY